MPGKLSLASLSGRASASSIDSATGEVRNSGRSSFDRLQYEQKRLSSSGKSSGAKTSKKPQTRIELDIESPPLVLHGDASNSSGALLSGRLKLVVAEHYIQIDGVRMALVAKVSTKKPVSSHCPDCASKTNELKVWNIWTEGALLKNGTHDYPFSYLIHGHLPATTHSTLGSIEYYLVATTTTLAGDEIKYEHPIKIQRALHPGPEKTSVRIFPPTTLSSNIVLPSVIHPIGDFPIQFRLEGLVQAQKQTRWKLRKVNWRIEEHTSMISPACPRHSAKLGGEGKGILHEDIHTIGGDEIKNGWKTDFGQGSGKVEMEFQVPIRPQSNLSCDVESPCGLSIAHNLVVELIVAEEHCPNKNSRLVTPTGAARVLRMQFKTIVTERSGLGISWDEEQPPTYGDVPESPPTYSQIDDYDLANDDLEVLYS